jgi:hypothetical protein
MYRLVREAPLECSNINIFCLSLVHVLTGNPTAPEKLNSSPRWSGTHHILFDFLLRKEKHLAGETSLLHNRRRLTFMGDRRAENEDRALKGEFVTIKGHDFDIKKEMVAIAVGTTGSSSVAILDKDGKWRKTHLLREGDEITEAVHAGEKCCVLYVNIKFETSG